MPRLTSAVIVSIRLVKDEVGPIAVVIYASERLIFRLLK
jgi:hypothetical protein